MTDEELKKQLDESPWEKLQREAKEQLDAIPFDEEIELDCILEEEELG